MPTRTVDAIITHTGHDCTIIYPNEVYVYQLLKESFKDGEKVTVEVKTRRKKRSLSQNNTLFWYIQEICDETGMDKETVKSVLARKFLSVPVLDRNGEIMADTSTGEVIERVRSTTDLSTLEFNDFTENIRMWASTFLNIYLPLPNEEIELKFK